jgi:cyanate permease
MDAGMLITVYLTSALVAAIIASIAAPVKRRHVGYWMIFAFLLPPIVLILLILPRGRRVHNYNRDPFHDQDDRDDLL